MNFQRTTRILVVVVIAMALQGCLTSVVTAPVKVVYGAGKLAVKGTAAAVRAVIPDDDKSQTQPAPQDKKPQDPQSDPQQPPKR